jgi:hypothetical protein
VEVVDPWWAIWRTKGGGGGSGGGLPSGSPPGLPPGGPGFPPGSPLGSLSCGGYLTEGFGSARRWLEVTA